MLKNLLQQFASFGLAGAMLLNPFSRAEALTEAQVIARLTNVPIFTVVTAKGEPVVISIKKDKQENQVVRFFLSHKDAQEALKDLESSKPDLAKQSKISVGSMTQFFDIQKQNKDKNTVFVVIPSRTSLDDLRTLRKNQGKTAEDFNRIPLFFATGKKDKSEGLLTVEENGKQVTPFFFERADLDNLLEQYKKQQPNLAQPRIDALPLEQVLGSMVTSDKNKPNPAVETIEFVPSREAVKKALESQPGGKKAPESQPGKKPAEPQPPAKKK